ncbi:MAG: YhcH/YjgK/YiaL family protein [Treponema sp.]|jgi:YhcH/YjgK/YiaL family protein|nr:YhcH/YjgK/YiaL family protein [Treponema sp.]
MQMIIIFDATDQIPVEGLKKAIRFLRDNDLSALSPDSIQAIDGDAIFAQVQEYDTNTENDLLFETHNVYYDLHYIVSGVEYICCASRKKLILKTPYDCNNDSAFYENPVHCRRLLLKAGDAIFIAPTEAHKPRCAWDNPQRVRKIVVKVKAHEQAAHD